MAYLRMSHRKGGAGRSRATRGVIGLCSMEENLLPGRGCPGGRELPSQGVCKQRLGEDIHSLIWRLWSNHCSLTLRKHQGFSVGEMSQSLIT